MKQLLADKGIYIFTTMRRSEDEASYIESTMELMEINERLCFAGILFFQNNSNDIEPWVLAQEILSKPYTQSPFIALNPVYLHPYTAAQKIMSLSRLYKKRLCLNFITGTSKSDLSSLGDHLPHDARYDRLIEYVTIINGLLTSKIPFSFDGKYYQIKHLRLPYTIEDELYPNYFIAGSSDKAVEARKATKAKKLQMAKPIVKYKDVEPGSSGLNFGIVARSTYKEAMEVLTEKFKPKYEEAEEMLQFSMLNTDAVWKQELLDQEHDAVFRLEPFKHFNADCPYLVGSYEQVTDYLLQYISYGIDTFIIDVERGEMDHIAEVMQSIIEEDHQEIAFKNN